MIMKKLWFLISLSILLFISLVFIIPIVLANLKLLELSEYLKLLAIVFSWPTAIFAICIIFFSRFYYSINSFLKNVGSMKFPGGFEIQRQDQPLPVEEPRLDTDEELVEDHIVMENSVDALPDEISERLSEIDIQFLQQQYAQQVSKSKYWKFSYLNLHFVHQTKNVLSWFSRSAPQTRQSYDILWTPYIFDQNQRNTILNVLLQNGMLSEVGGVIKITDEGVAFLRFIGVLPSLPPITVPPPEKTA